MKAHVGSLKKFAWITFFDGDNSAVKGEIVLKSDGRHRLEIFGELDEKAKVISLIYIVAVRRFKDVSKAKDLLMEIVKGYCDTDMDAVIDVTEF